MRGEPPADNSKSDAPIATAPSRVVAEEREPDPYREDGGEG